MTAASPAKLAYMRRWFETAPAIHLVGASGEYQPDAELLQAIEEFRRRRIAQIDAELDQGKTKTVAPVHMGQSP